MERQLRRALSIGGADYLEIRIEEAVTTSVIYAGRELERIGESSSLGGCVRAAAKGGWGFASFNNLDDLHEKVKRAVSMAQQVGREETRLAPQEPYKETRITSPGRDPREVSLEEKHDTVDRYNRIILETSGIQTSSVRYEDRWKRKLFANSDGTFTTFEEVFCGVSLAAIAREGNVVQTYHHTYGNLSGFDRVIGREEQAEDAARRAVELLGAERVKSGKIRISDLAEQFQWVKVKETLSLSAKPDNDGLVITVRNDNEELSARDVTIDCGKEIKLATCSEGEVEIVKQEMIILPEVSPKSTCSVKVTFA